MLLFICMNKQSYHKLWYNGINKESAGWWQQVDHHAFVLGGWHDENGTI